MIEKNCANCRFWKPIPGAAGNFCTRVALTNDGKRQETATAHVTSKAAYLVTGFDHYCNQWIRKPGPKKVRA